MDFSFSYILTVFHPGPTPGNGWNARFAGVRCLLSPRALLMCVADLVRQANWQKELDPGGWTGIVT